MSQRCLWTKKMLIWLCTLYIPCHKLSLIHIYVYKRQVLRIPSSRERSVFLYWWCDEPVLPAIGTLAFAQRSGAMKAPVAVSYTHLDVYKRQLQRMPRQSTRAKWCSPSAHPTTVLRSISVEKAIWHPCPPHRLAFKMCIRDSFGTLAVDLGCFPFDNDIYLTLSDSQASILWHSEFDKLR